MTTTLPLKRGFATIGNSKYRTPVAPPTSLDGAEPANPKQALPLPVTELLVPKVVPTTEASHRKSNAQIPYTRVVTDTRHLPDDGDVVFIRSPDGRKAAGKMRVSANDKTDVLAGLAASTKPLRQRRPATKYDSSSRGPSTASCSIPNGRWTQKVLMPKTNRWRARRPC